jgi:ATP-dependent Clp protease ATP-binding subunit ClpA
VFGKFTKDAKSVVVGALRSAEESESPQVAEEHVLLALLDQDDSRAAVLLAAHDVPKDEVREAYRAAQEVGGMSKADAEALRELGIDLDAVVASIRREHGDKALAGSLSGPRRGARTRGFTEGVRQVLVGAHREAVNLGDRYLGDEHLLLALLSGGTVAADALAAHGITYDGIRSQLTQMRAK